MDFAPLCPACGRPVPRACEYHAYGGCEDCWVGQSGMPGSTSLTWNRRGSDGESVNVPMRMAAQPVARLKPGPKPRAKLCLVPSPIALAGANHVGEPVRTSPEQED